MLALDIEFLTGSIVAARPERNEQLEWPPQPDRVFSALVASWGARGERPEERSALEWLEAQAPPAILHGECVPRTAPIVFVPPNDFKTSESGFDVLPSHRRRQARRFIAGRISDDQTTVRLVWRDDPNESDRRALDAIAHDTSYVGHSTSLTRCRFTTGAFDIAKATSPQRRVYVGRLAELEAAYKAGWRPNPGAFVQSTTTAMTPVSVFSHDWIVLRTLPGCAPPNIRAFPSVARRLRDTLLVGYTNAVGAPPEWLSGHRPDGSPSCRPHVAIVPLANWEHHFASGELMGCAIVLPSDVPFDALYDAIRERLASGNPALINGNRSIEIGYGARSVWHLQPVFIPTKASLRPKRWFGPSAQWSTATPIALDRFPKGRTIEQRRAEIGDLIIRACHHAGLPKPKDITFSDISAVYGAEPVLRGRDVPNWQKWQLPRSLRGRYLTHASLVFDEAISGPVILGCGRFVGLGLCFPSKEAQ